MLEPVHSRVRRKDKDSMGIYVSGARRRNKLREYNSNTVSSTFSADIDSIASSMGDSSGLIQTVILGTGVDVIIFYLVNPSLIETESPTN